MRFNILEKNKYCTGVQTPAFEDARYGTQTVLNFYKGSLQSFI